MNKQINSYNLASIGCILLLLPTTSYAYLDPGTGSLLFSAIISIVSVLMFWGRTVMTKFSQALMVLTGKKADHGAPNDIVIYSEGGQYWNLFMPVIDALSARQVKVSYWTSDDQDPGLEHSSEWFEPQFIGKGNVAYAKLNVMAAKVCVMTTPGLDVLQIKRSKSVAHYSHLVHAPTTGTYKLFSFDYFDSVMCSGPHQISGIRELERKRGTPAKQLLETGCVYMDVLAKELNERKHGSRAETRTVLVAPSWGKNGLLNRCGEELLSGLLELNDINVIVRPHPQSLIVEKENITQLQNMFSNFKDRLTWDLEPSGFDSMLVADVMVSDFSGVVFDYSLVFQKPVICVDFEISLTGMDANHLDDGLWEIGVLDRIGKQIDVAEISSLPQLVNSILEETSMSGELRELRASSLFNFGSAGEIAAEQLISITTRVS